MKPAEGLSTPGVFKALSLSPNEELPGAGPQALLDEFAENVYLRPSSAISSRPPRRCCRCSPTSALGSTRWLPRRDAVGLGHDDLRRQPRGVVDTWQDAIRAKFDVEVYEEMFCRRLDERLWYAEPEGAKTRRPRRQPLVVAGAVTIRRKES